MSSDAAVRKAAPGLPPDIVQVTDPTMPQGKNVRLRLLKQDKLRFKAQFDQARRDGIKIAGPAIVAIVAPSPEGKRECGVICSKKYSLLSVVRNRARRLLWESFRMLKPDLSPCRILLIPRRKLMNYNRMQATAELTELLKKQQVIVTANAPSAPEY
jgi:ribonuclease P protein component